MQRCAVGFTGIMQAPGITVRLVANHIVDFGDAVLAKGHAGRGSAALGVRDLGPYWECAGGR